MRGEKSCYKMLPEGSLNLQFITGLSFGPSITILMSTKSEERDSKGEALESRRVNTSSCSSTSSFIMMILMFLEVESPSCHDSVPLTGTYHTNDK